VFLPTATGRGYHSAVLSVVNIRTYTPVARTHITWVLMVTRRHSSMRCDVSYLACLEVI
jgi:hypothetical protein